MSSFKKKANVKKPQGAGKIRMQGAKPKAQPSRQMQIKQAMMESDSEDQYNSDNNEQFDNNNNGSESSEEMGDEFDLDQMEEDSADVNNGYAYYINYTHIHIIDANKYAIFNFLHHDQDLNVNFIFIFVY